MLNPAVSLSQIGSKDPTLGSNVWSGGGSYGIIMVLLLLLVFCLVAVFIYVKRIGMPRMKKSGKLEIMETRPLGGRQFIVVGKYGDERFLLGVCPGKIEYLCPLQGIERQSENDFEVSLNSEIKKDQR